MDITPALSIMPYTQSTFLADTHQTSLTLFEEGMDLNPLFTSATTFRPSSIIPSSSGAGAELDLFLLTRIPLVHGWLVDPGSPAARAISEEGTEDYDSAVALIAEADHLAGGMLVQVEDDVVGEGEAGPSSGGTSDNRGHRKNGKGPGGSWTYEERRKIQNGSYPLYVWFHSLIYTFSLYSRDNTRIPRCHVFSIDLSWSFPSRVDPPFGRVRSTVPEFSLICAIQRR